ncbi:MAG TPA: sigma-70 family RNA polymerase sigma factor [Polyangia bacterium]|nr:sigma-70 family RNA polymerase sigma factor [Polyangia bacterium]
MGPADDGGDDAAALVEAIASRRDRAAFARLFALYAPRIKGHLRARGATPAAAEEVTQEVMLAVWRKAAQFDRTKGRVATWLFTIARNGFVDHQRGQRWPEPERIEESSAEPAPDDALAAARGRRDLRVALDELPVEQRDALAGAYYRGRTMRELADEQRLPLGTIKTRVRLALARLRARLGGEAGDEGDHDD